MIKRMALEMRRVTESRPDSRGVDLDDERVETRPVFLFLFFA